MLTPDRTPEGWGGVARAYDGYVAPVMSKFAADMLDLTDLRPGERALDVAAGTGALALLAARRGARVVATDFAPPMVELLRERAKEAGVALEAEVMDGQALTVPSGAFDAAYSNFGLIFFPDRAAGFRELRRALRPGGRAAVSAWAAPERLEWFVALNAALARVAPDLPKPPQPPPVFSLADPQRFAEEMRAAGFRDVRVETVRHAMVAPAPEDVWTMMTTTNPVVPLLLGRLGPERVERLREEALAEFAARRRGDRVVLEGDAHVGLGVA